MSMTMQNTTMVARLTRDPDIRTVNGKNGDFLAATLNLAVDRPYSGKKDANGNAITETDFFRCELTGGKVNYAQYARKGSLVAVTGYFYNPPEFTNKEGIKIRESQFRIEDIVLLEKKQQQDGQGGNYNQQNGYQNQNQGYPQNNQQNGYQNQGYQQNGYQNQNQGYPQNNQQNGYQNQGYQQNGYNQQQNNQQNGYQNQGYPQNNQQNQQNFMNPPEGFSPAEDDPFGLAQNPNNY